MLTIVQFVLEEFDEETLQLLPFRMGKICILVWNLLLNGLLFAKFHLIGNFALGHQ